MATDSELTEAPIKAVDPVEPIKAVDLIKAVEPIKAVDPVKAVEPVDPVDPIGPTVPAAALVAKPQALVGTAPAKKPPLKDRLKAIFKDYPQVAVFTYLGLSAIAIAGFSIAIGIGAEPSTATGVLGVIGAGWLAAKVTVPLRILATLALTPPIAALLKKLKRKKPPVVVEDEE